MPPKPSEIETEKIERAITKSHLEHCQYMKEKDVWFDSKLLKVAGVVIGLLSPLFVWIVLGIFEVKSDIAVMKQKQEAIVEIKDELKLMRSDLNQIKIDLSTMKVTHKGNP